MDIEKHKSEFDRVVEEYGLAEKAEEIAGFLLKKSEITAEEFATFFAMTEHDAEIFLSFIEKGVRFRENHLDK
jgi:hypothetical protein